MKSRIRLVVCKRSLSQSLKRPLFRAINDGVLNISVNRQSDGLPNTNRFDLGQTHRTLYSLSAAITLL